MGLWDLIRKMMQEDQKPEASETQKETKTETANATSHSEKKPLYDKIILSGVKHTIEDDIWEVAYEIDDTFKQTRSHSAEVEALSVYAYERDDWTEADNPSVSILTDDLVIEAIEEYQEKGTVEKALKLEPADGMFLFKAVMEYYDQMLYFYAFEMDRDGDNWQLCLCMYYPKEYVNTENEKMLMQVLDEAAASFRRIDIED